MRITRDDILNSDLTQSVGGFNPFSFLSKDHSNQYKAQYQAKIEGYAALEMAEAMFEWKMPKFFDQYPANFMEQILCMFGMGVIWRDNDKGYQAAPCVPVDFQSNNMYLGRPHKVLIVDPYGMQTTTQQIITTGKGQNGVFFTTRLQSFSDEMKYIKKGTMELQAVYAAIFNQYTRSLAPNFISGSFDDNKINTKAIKDAIESGVNIIPVTQGRGRHGQVLDGKSEFRVTPAYDNQSYKVPEMHTDIATIREEMYTKLGIDNSGVNKRERALTAEVDSNDAQISLIQQNKLKARQVACEECKRLFSEDKFDISVKLSDQASAIDYGSNNSEMLKGDVRDESITNRPDDRPDQE